MGASALSKHWAVERAAFEQLEAHYARHSVSPEAAGNSMRLAERSVRLGPILEAGGVVVIPVHGLLVQNPDFIDRLFGAQALGDIAALFDLAVAEDSVRAIVLDIDSPGGTVAGTQELASAVYAANARKPVVAVASGAMTSAAYWIGAAADSVFVSSDTTAVGSIGVLTKHVDISERERMQGLKTTVIYSGKFKAEGSPHAPLNEEGRQSIQEKLDYLYAVFVSDVATFRGVPVATVVRSMADARIFFGRQAVEAGLADGRATVAEVVAKLGGGSFAKRRSSTKALNASTPAPLAAAIQTVEERCRGRWSADSALRSEFGDNFEAFLAWERVHAAGRVVNFRSKSDGKHA